MGVHYGSHSTHYDFPGGAGFGTLLSNAVGVSSIPGWRTKIPHTLLPKNQKRKAEAIL